jgi:hypothetical protein
MIVIQVHGWKHRITKTGIFQSCPTKEGYNWVTRTGKEMNLSGGDIDLIRTSIKRLAECIPENQELPHAEEKNNTVPDPSETYR